MTRETLPDEVIRLWPEGAPSTASVLRARLPGCSATASFRRASHRDNSLKASRPRH
jgi:hypothetical protein